MKKRDRFVKTVCLVLALLMVLSVLVSVLGSGIAGAVSQSEIDALKQQRTEIELQMADVESQISVLQAEQNSVIEQKAALDHQIELARQEIELINEQLDIYDRLIESKAEELAEAEESELLQKERFRSRMRAMEENSVLSYIAVLFKATSFSDLLSRLDLISDVMEYDSQLEDDYIAAREHVEQVKADYEQTYAMQEIARAELLEKQAELEKKIDEACELIAALEKDIEAFKAEYEKYEAEERKVQAEIDSMIAELQRREEEAKKLAIAQTNLTGTGSYIWPCPSSYTVTSEFGYRIHPIFNTEKYHAGIDIAGSRGSNVLAADSGTVSIATFSSSYGNYVVINHGGGNTTLYAHMDSLAVSAGDEVSQGDVIGYVGSTGWSTGPHLHFEVTVGGSRVDPLNYFTGYYIA